MSEILPGRGPAGIIPPGVTKRSLDTLLSRGNPFSTGAEVVVCCVHGRQKRENKDGFAVDLAYETVQMCACCENMYAKSGKHQDEPGPCPTCAPTGASR